MREFRIQIKDAAFGALVDLALRERRAPRDQAAVLLENQLQSLVAQKSEPARAPGQLPAPAEQPA